MAEKPVADQQSAWLGQGPEVLHAPVMRSGSKRIIRVSALVIVVVGLVGAAVYSYLLAGGSPDRTGTGQITAPRRRWPLVRSLSCPVSPRRHR